MQDLLSHGASLKRRAAALVYDRAMSSPADPLRTALEDRVRFETLVGDIASQFVSIESDQIDDAIRRAQQQLVEVLGLDRSSLFQTSGSGSIELTHTFSLPGLPGVVIGNDPSKLFPWTLSRLVKGETVSYSSVSEVPEGSIDRDSLIRVGTKSTFTVPLMVSGRLIGVLTFATVREERHWSPATMNRLTLIAQVFASALARKRADEELRRVVEDNARLRERLTEENNYLQREVKVHQGPSFITGDSAPIQRLLGQIAQVAPTGATALLLGETGTGKELVATAIHEGSPRKARAMVSVNCAAIPATLIESELFGVEKGAFTGAVARQVGRFELANESTIFLDEVGELPAETQVKLLRVLQERQIERLGSSKPIKIDVRVVAATNRDLEQEVAEGRFREDLYYRLNVFSITVPPLRERAEDIPDLVWTFVQEFSRGLGKHFDTISKEHMLALKRYAWPGNVRELRNVIERAVIVSSGPKLIPELPRAKPVSARRHNKLADVERDHILSVLERVAWRIRGDGGAAELLGLKPSTLEDRMAKLHLRRPGRQ